MPGPPPDPNARRRNKRMPFVQLPAEGRKGRPPKWPLPPDLTLVAKLQTAQDIVEQLGDREDLSAAERRRLNAAAERVVFLGHQRDNVAEAEAALWAELWTTPQAMAWQRLRYHREVAQYVRWKVRAEWGELDAAREARALSDRLGLTPMALQRLQWQIVEDEVGPRRAPTPRKQQPKDTSARSRLRIAE